MQLYRPRQCLLRCGNVREFAIRCQPCRQILPETLPQRRLRVRWQQVEPHIGGANGVGLLDNQLPAGVKSRRRSPLPPLRRILPAAAGQSVGRLRGGGYRATNLEYTRMQTARSSWPLLCWMVTGLTWANSWVGPHIEVSERKCAFAFQFGVDVYSSNTVLQKELNSVAWAAAVGYLSAGRLVVAQAGNGVALVRQQLAKRGLTVTEEVYKRVEIIA